ncbi:phosphoglucosamine mutase [Candidatus Bathyarchaeota archaeon]|nr:phosphoglucosamine mutase [Candidatus Bathyarchaeota archaeon]
MKPKLFGSSGIRGVVNKEITPTLAHRVGTALATIHKGGTIIVGRDARVSGPMIEGALFSGLSSAGADIYSIGLVPTPITAWTVRNLDANAGIEVTASHNPPEYNGLKIFNEKGMSLTEKEQLDIEDILENCLYQLSEWDGVGILEPLYPLDQYTEELILSIELEIEESIAFDLFNGATCTVVQSIMDEFSIQAEFINGIPDGTFPSGNPEPDENSLLRIGKFMKARDIDIGFGFDGDGDRMMPIDSSGHMVSPDRALASFAAYLVEKNQGGTVVTHVGTSMNVDEMVESEGGKVIRTPVGDSYITETMAESKAIFGGEPVGAWVHPDIHMCPDGILSALKLLEAIKDMEMSLGEFVNRAPAYPINREKVVCPNEKKIPILSKIKSGYQDTFNNIKTITTIDGVRLELEEGWILIRTSGTEPLIRITVEAKTDQMVKEYTEKGISLIKKSFRDIR